MLEGNVSKNTVTSIGELTQSRGTGGQEEYCLAVTGHVEGTVAEAVETAKPASLSETGD